MSEICFLSVGYRTVRQVAGVVGFAVAFQYFTFGYKRINNRGVASTSTNPVYDIFIFRYKNNNKLGSNFAPSHKFIIGENTNKHKLANKLSVRPAKVVVLIKTRV